MFNISQNVHLLGSVSVQIGCDCSFCLGCLCCQGLVGGAQVSRLWASSALTEGLVVHYTDSLTGSLDQAVAPSVGVRVRAHLFYDEGRMEWPAMFLRTRNSQKRQWSQTIRTWSPKTWITAFRSETNRFSGWSWIMLTHHRCQWRC